MTASVTQFEILKTTNLVLKIKNTDIASYLNLPPVKLHCSMLAEDAIKAAVEDFKGKKEQKKAAHARMMLNKTEAL